jgi:hypothetical protein
MSTEVLGGGETLEERVTPKIKALLKESGLEIMLRVIVSEMRAKGFGVVNPGLMKVVEGAYEIYASRVLSEQDREALDELTALAQAAGEYSR